MLCLPLALPSSSVSLTAVGRFGACFLLVLVGSCTWSFYTVIKGRITILNSLVDAALGELSVVTRGQPCLMVGDFNVEPTKIPCLAKGISAGLWVDLEASWALASGKPPAPTFKRASGACGGPRRDFMVGCPLAAAAVVSCRVQPDRWIAPHLAFRTLFDCCRWSSRFAQPVSRIPLWPASWLPAVDKSRVCKSVEVQRVWEVNDERLQFVSSGCFAAG